MNRYHVDTPAKLLLVQIALDQALGLRDAAGNATPKEQLLHLPGGYIVPASAALGPLHQCYDRPGTKSRLIDGDDGTAALEIDEAPKIDAELGKTISGVVLPRAQDLVTLAPAKGNDKLPPGIMRKLDLIYLIGIPLLEGVPPEAVDNSGAQLPQAKRDALLAAIAEIGDVRLRAAMVKRSQG